MNPTVKLGQSTSLRGLEVTARGAQRSVLAFLGIPYAEPPIGTLRFQPPMPLKLWKGEKNATKFGNLVALVL